MSRPYEISEKIRQHVILFEKIVEISKLIRIQTENEMVDDVIFNLDNRERLMNVIQEMQSSIEKDLDELMPVQITQDFIGTIREWQDYVNESIAFIQACDNESTSLLEKGKSELTQEIASIFKQKQLFKGYNLNDVKR